MSIVNKKQRQRPETAPSANEPSAKGATMYPWSRKKRRRLTALAAVGLGLALLVGMLPTIIVRTPLAAYFVRRAAALNGTITFHDASIGWFSAASVSGIEIRDAQGETVLEADRLTCDRSLLKLLWNSSNAGMLRIEKPRLNAKLLRDGNNLESLLAPWLTGPSSSSRGGVDLKLEVVDGEVAVFDQQTQQSWHVTELQFALDLARQPASPARIEGTAKVDLNLLLQPYCGTSVRFAGAGTIPFAYRGPLALAGGEASVALPFSGANVYGFQIGPGELKLHLANGTLHADPLEVSCNQGRLALQPELCFDRQPMEFRLSAGTLASHIQLDQAACRSALKYVVPVLASVTQSEGQFSIQLEGCRIPLGDPSRAEIAGRIIVHSAAMTPGPLVEQLASLVSASPSLVHIEPESAILFRMTGGRIYHQGLALEFPDVTMRTYGSVGLDESLKLMVETSVPLAWLPSNAVTDAIRKQKMQIPLGGTLKSPRLDSTELARVKNQLLGNLGVLESVLGSQLNRLFPQAPQR